MVNRYSREEGIKRFYYQPASRYCAIIAQDRHHVREVRKRILEHYLGPDYEYSQVVFVGLRKGRKSVGELIHVEADLAALLIGETRFEDIDIVISPIDFEEFRNKKRGLQRLIDSC